MSHTDKMTGGCHCGAVRYEAKGKPMHHALCHCDDCRKSSGAPMVGWAMYSAEDVRVTKGEAKVYESSEHGRRHFCPSCGTGLFYTNSEMLPGITDVQVATLDDANAVPAEVHIQTADRLVWMKDTSKLPEFERYPPQE